jgi:hypothetical protein
LRITWRNGKTWFLTDQQFRRFKDFLREHFRVVEMTEAPELEADDCSDREIVVEDYFEKDEETETLTIKQIDERMNEMVACAGRFGAVR